jgi:hypothetical protein
MDLRWPTDQQERMMSCLHWFWEIRQRWLVVKSREIYSTQNSGPIDNLSPSRHLSYGPTLRLGTGAYGTAFEITTQ